MIKTDYRKRQETCETRPNPSTVRRVLRFPCGRANVPLICVLRVGRGDEVVADRIAAANGDKGACACGGGLATLGAGIGDDAATLSTASLASLPCTSVVS
jgi:hypothetical protein